MLITVSEELDSDSLKSRLFVREDRFLKFADFALRVRDTFPNNGASIKLVINTFQHKMSSENAASYKSVYKKIKEVILQILNMYFYFLQNLPLWSVDSQSCSKYYKKCIKHFIKC